ncbi:hypothetical protein HanPSC8_Chr12g0536281 [Helianthus annuus]|nr:hypothetical protein HanPSC8_Chr12g0536281 [Helianthus annuus]
MKMFSLKLVVQCRYHNHPTHLAALTGFRSLWIHEAPLIGKDLRWFKTYYVSPPKR